MGDFVRSIFVYEKRAEFLSLFWWCALIALGTVAYAKFQGNPLGIFDHLVLFWGSMSLLTWAGLKWDWLGARWLGVLCLVSFALTAWGFNLLLQQVSFSTFFGFVIVGWAYQLARMDFARQDLREAVDALPHLVPLVTAMGDLAGELGHTELAERVEDTFARALEHHLARHEGDYAECEDDLCLQARTWEGIAAIPTEDFRRMIRADSEEELEAHEALHTSDQEDASSEDTDGR